MPGAQGLDDMQHERDSGLHVKHPGPEHAAFGDPILHLRNRADWINRVCMPEQKHRFRGSIRACEVDLKMVAEFSLAMDLDLAPEFTEPRCQHRVEAVHRGFNIAG